MTWETKYPEIAAGLERLTQKKAITQRREATKFPKTTPEEDKARLKLKKERLRHTNTEVYNSLPDKEEPDWAAMISQKDPFRK